MSDRAFAPHCDASVLHAPGECVYCDHYPDWQGYRMTARIAFTGQAPSDSVSPCPSMWFRDPGVRDRWYGNAPVIHEDADLY